ncbi:hypothetical protein R6Q59_005604 [Mikania micrantha]
MADKTDPKPPPLHPIYTVNNIQTRVRILDGIKLSYPTWVKLFTLHVKGFDVIHHINGTPAPAKNTPAYEAWEKIDSIVLQWIYGTLADDLLARVLVDDSTAHEAWLRVKQLFMNNKGSRAAALQHELTNLNLVAMPSVEAYCQRIRELADQLCALDFPINDNQRVLHLVRGLPSKYKTVASLLNQTLPPWEDACNHAVQAMSMQPDDDQWYLDTGASAHVTHNSGKLESFSDYSPIASIFVGNGNRIPVMGSGNVRITTSSKPLQLNNVLFNPNIIKNLISVRKFNTDNYTSIEFDPFGFSVKDFRDGTILSRHNSSSDLYPLTNASATACVVSTKDAPFWHHRLGHPGQPVMEFLRSKNFVSCNKMSFPFVCQSCQLSKHKRLPFSDSVSCTIYHLLLFIVINGLHQF